MLNKKTIPIGNNAVVCAQYIEWFKFVRPKYLTHTPADTHSVHIGMNSGEEIEVRGTEQEMQLLLDALVLAVEANQ